MQNIVVFLGPPGIGKGTQAKILSDQYGMKHISTGEIIREEVGNNSPIGKLMEEMGWSSPEKLDVLVLEALNIRLGKIGDGSIVLDGCPRSLGQAKGLDEMLEGTRFQVSKVIEFYGDEQSLIDRMSGRYSCVECKAIYHDTAKPTLIANLCDACGSKDFYRRPEDSPETIAKRLVTYREMTLPVIEYYTGHGLVERINGIAPIVAITASLEKALL
jgi:adenylate kinase